VRTKAYHLVALVSAVTNAAAFVTIARPGFIVAAQIQVSTATKVDLSSYTGELSTVGQLGTATNDSQGGFLSVTLGPFLVSTAVGSDLRSATAVITGIAIPVQAGDRIFINTDQWPQAAVYTAYVHVSE
jgi:hypothetical protein